jgi:hypothetical protein
MNRSSSRSLRALIAAALGLAFASFGEAARVDNAGPPASSAVMRSPQQAAAAQTDESASLRHGVITALDQSGARLQVQGIWLELVADKTQVLRNGQPAKADTLKVGDAIKFMVVPGAAETPALRVIYAP